MAAIKLDHIDPIGLNTSRPLCGVTKYMKADHRNTEHPNQSQNYPPITRLRWTGSNRHFVESLRLVFRKGNQVVEVCSHGAWSKVSFFTRTVGDEPEDGIGAEYGEKTGVSPSEGS